MTEILILILKVLVYIKMSIDPHRRQNSPGSPSRYVAVPAACWVRCERGECEASCWSCGFSSLQYFLVWALEKGAKAHEEVAGSRGLCIGPHHWWMSSSSCFSLQDSWRAVYLQADSLNWESLMGGKDACYSILNMPFRRELLCFMQMNQVWFFVCL